MNVRLISFGEIEVEGDRFTEDLVIEKGQIRKRKKGPSKALRGGLGHTPLSAAEEIPWHGEKLYIGTGAYGRLPVMEEIYREAKRQGVEVVAKPTPEICALLAERSAGEINAILHVTY